jgi:8-oxo-dGTP pyrophosphatase MutT (NUDIX family)
MLHRRACDLVRRASLGRVEQFRHQPAEVLDLGVGEHPLEHESVAGELLLQKRSAWKDREPGKWDSSAAGHLEPAETYADAAGRETAEELGIRPALERLGKINACPGTGQEFVEARQTSLEFGDQSGDIIVGSSDRIHYGFALGDALV